MAVADRNGLPIAVYTTSASPHEVTLVGKTLDASHISEIPQRLIGDRAYDSDRLDAELAEKEIEMIAPHKSNRVKPSTQDGRVLRRYARRWQIERLFAWLQSFRRIHTRWDRLMSSYRGWLQLGCIVVLLRRYF